MPPLTCMEEKKCENWCKCGENGLRGSSERAGTNWEPRKEEKKKEDSRLRKTGETFPCKRERKMVNLRNND